MSRINIKTTEKTLLADTIEYLQLPMLLMASSRMIAWTRSFSTPMKQSAWSTQSYLTCNGRAVGQQLKVVENRRKFAKLFLPQTLHIWKLLRRRDTSSQQQISLAGLLMSQQTLRAEFIQMSTNSWWICGNWSILRKMDISDSYLMFCLKLWGSTEMLQ